MVYIKRIFTFLMFTAGLAGLLISSSYIFLPKSNEENSGMEEFKANGILGEKNDSIDVLILGDSESYSSIIPLQIWQEKGYTSYVCGTSGQTLDYTEVMLKRTFEKQSPKIVFLETSAIYRKLTLKNVTFTKTCDYFSVFRYHNRWKTLKLNEINKAPEYTFTDDCKGYRFNTLVKPSTKYKSYMTPTDESEPIENLNKQNVKNIKKQCDEQGAKLVLISTPSTKNWDYKRHNGIQALAEELDCEYIDMNILLDEIPIDWENDTSDQGDHLNYFGAKKCTAFISEYLSNTELLTDKRGNPDYDKWNKDSEAFEKNLL